MAARTRTAAICAFLMIGFIAGASCSPRPRAAGPPPPRGVLNDAFAVAFGKPAPYATIDESGDHVLYNPQALIDVAPGVVALVSKEEIPGGCRACAGALTIDYLRRGRAGLSRMGSWPRVGGLGKWGAVLAWTVRTDIDDGPTLVTRRDERDGACTATTEELITLRPTAPVKIATVVVATAYDPAPGERAPGPHVAGEIRPIVPGQRFEVVLTGSDHLRQVFKRQGDIFATSDPGATGC